MGNSYFEYLEDGIVGEKANIVTFVITEGNGAHEFSNLMIHYLN